MKKDFSKDIRQCCLKCGYLGVEVLSTGEILCKNPKCMALTWIDDKSQEVKIKIDGEILQ